MQQRSAMGYASLLCVLGLIISFLLQYGFGFSVCILCECQRYLLLSLAFVTALGYVIYPKGWRVFYGAYGALMCLGLALALRHVWLLHWSDHTTEACLPDFVTLWHLSSFPDWLSHVIGPSGCGHMRTFWGLGLPDGVLLGYMALSYLGYQMRSRGA